MDLLKTILIYMSMVFVSSVQTAPEAALLPLETTDAPTAQIVQAATHPPAPTPTPTPVPTPAITPNNDYKTLQVGARGEQVKTLQRRLAELGYYTGDVDGAYGNQTRRAVERFQYYHGLSADGIAGKRTLTVLYESKDIVFAPVDVTPTPPPPAPSGTAGPAAETAGAPTATHRATPVATTPAPTQASPSPSTAPPPAQASDAVPAKSAAPSGAPTQTATQIPALTPEPVMPDSPGPDQPQDTTEAPPAGEETPAAGEEPPATGEEPPASGEDSPVPQQEATPEPEAQPPVALEGYSFWWEGREQPVLDPGTVDNPDAEPMALPPLMDAQGQALVPLLRILEDGGIWVIPQESGQHWEYAFALGEDLYQLSFDIGQEGSPTGLAILKNSEPQLMERRVAVLENGVLYLYLADVETITGIAFTLEAEAQLYTVTLPAEP